MKLRNHDFGIVRFCFLVHDGTTFWDRDAILSGITVTKINSFVDPSQTRKRIFLSELNSDPEKYIKRFLVDLLLDAQEDYDERLKALKKGEFNFDDFFKSRNNWKEIVKLNNLERLNSRFDFLVKHFKITLDPEKTYTYFEISKLGNGIESAVITQYEYSNGELKEVKGV